MVVWVAAPAAGVAGMVDLSHGQRHWAPKSNARHRPIVKAAAAPAPMLAQMT
ncbi:MAG: hypothetical protein ACI9EB_002019 [Pseudomonas sp.]|jgi:hypothetical protein